MFIECLYPDYHRSHLCGINATIDICGLTEKQYRRLSELVGNNVAIIDLTDHRNTVDLNKKRAMFEVY